MSKSQDRCVVVRLKFTREPKKATKRFCDTEATFKMPAAPTIQPGTVGWRRGATYQRHISATPLEHSKFASMSRGDLAFDMGPRSHHQNPFLLETLDSIINLNL